MVERTNIKATPPDRLLRIAVIGISGYGRIHLSMALSETLKGRAVLAAAVVINPEDEPVLVKTLQRLEVRIYPDVDTLFREESGKLDICLIPTAPHYHAEMAEKAMRHGCHVLVEKPLSCSVEEAESILKTAEECDRKCAVGFQNMVAPEVRMVKRWILEGRIGSPLSISGIGLWPRSKSYYQRNNWAGRLHIKGKKVLDSPVSNAFAHFIHLILFWGSEAKDACASVEHFEADLFRAQAIESFDTFSIRGHLNSNIHFQIQGTHSCRESFGPAIRISGDSGTIHWHFRKGVSIELSSGQTETLKPIDPFLGRMLVMEEFVNLLENRKSNVCPASMALCHTRLVEELSLQTEIKDVDPRLIGCNRDMEGNEQIFITNIEQKMLQYHRGEIAKIPSPSSLAETYLK